MKASVRTEQIVTIEMTAGEARQIALVLAEYAERLHGEDLDGSTSWGVALGIESALGITVDRKATQSATEGS